MLGWLKEQAGNQLTHDVYGLLYCSVSGRKRECLRLAFFFCFDVGLKPKSACIIMDNEVSDPMLDWFSSIFRRYVLIPCD